MAASQKEIKLHRKPSVDRIPLYFQDLIQAVRLSGKLLTRQQFGRIIKITDAAVEVAGSNYCFSHLLNKYVNLIEKTNDIFGHCSYLSSCRVRWEDS